jgi:hypothetical protein
MKLGSFALLALVVASACTGATPATEGPSGVAAGPSTPGGTSGSVTATPGGATPSPVSLKSIDACTLLSEDEIRELTGTSNEFDGLGPVTSTSPHCFWAMPVPGEPAFVEIRIFRATNIDGFKIQAGASCTTAPVQADVEAVGGTCTDPQNKVYLAVASGGVAVSLEVNEPERPLAPADLLTTIQPILEDILAG